MPTFRLMCYTDAFHIPTAHVVWEEISSVENIFNSNFYHFPDTENESHTGWKDLIQLVLSGFQMSEGSLTGERTKALWGSDSAAALTFMQWASVQLFSLFLGYRGMQFNCTFTEMFQFIIHLFLPPCAQFLFLLSIRYCLSFFSRITPLALPLWSDNWRST